MRIILTKHAKERMIERNIKVNEIEEAIEFPDYTVSKNNKIEAHKKINSEMIKIIYQKQDKFIKIITVIKR